MSECKSFRSDLDAFRDGLLDEERSLQIDRHVEGCDACRAEIEQAEAFEAQIRQRAVQWQPPEYLWQRIRHSADALQSGKRRGKPLSWAVAATLIIAVIAIGFNVDRQSGQSSADSVASVLVNEFHTFAVSRRELDYIDSEPVAIRQWFGDKVDFRAPMPSRVDGIQLAGGRLCNMLNQRVASYMYRSDGAWVSLYIMKSGEGLQDHPGHHLSVQGYGYIEWENEGLRYSLVGDISVDQLHRIADEMYTKI